MAAPGRAGHGAAGFCSALHGKALRCKALRGKARFSLTDFGGVAMTTNLSYTPGPGDLWGPCEGHPGDPRYTDRDNDCSSLSREAREFLTYAEYYLRVGNLAKAREWFIAARGLIQEAIGA